MTRFTTGRRRTVGLAVAIPLSLGLGVGATAAPPDHANPGGQEQPGLEARVKPILTRGQSQYRDLNANGRLDQYENWRLDPAIRAKGLLRLMTIEEKAGLMLIDTLNAGCYGAVVNPATDYIENQYMHRFIFRNPVDSTATCPTTPSRSGPTITAAQAAEFTNGVQEMSEATRLGIPALFKSNARNHIDPDARAGINVSAGAFSAFPKEAGIAAAALGDDAYMGVVEDFAAVMGEEWASIGLRGMYGYMADLSTDPRWYRVHETFTEDADLGADIMGQLVETLQGTSVDDLALSPETDVALTMKHFPGGGPQELGLDPHFAHGKTQVYPGDGFDDALKPFVAAIDRGVAAIMPYYGVPIDVTYEGTTFQHTGFAFSSEIVNWLLREQLGFQGYVNSDTGIINDRAWGLEDNTVPERVAAAINGGTDTLSGFHDVQTILDLVDSGLVTEDRVDEAALRLLIPMFEMGLFEDPYVDPDVAAETVGAYQDIALDVQRKSVVLLQNDDDLLPLETGSTLYVLGAYNADQVDEYGYTIINGNDAATAPGTGAAATADYAVINVTASTAQLVAGADRPTTVTSTYRSNFTDTGWFDPTDGSWSATNDPTDTDDFYVVGGMDPDYGVNPSMFETYPGSGEYVAGLDGASPWGASDRCVAQGGALDVVSPTPSCTDNGLIFGGSLPWEAGVLDFSGMSGSQSWRVTPTLEQIQTVMEEIGAENVILHIYFRQPYVLDEASGLLDAGAIVAGFGVTDTALFDVLSGDFAPQGRMPFALANTIDAIAEQEPDLPGYAPEDTLFPFGWGLTY